MDNGTIGGRTNEMTGYYKVADFIFAVRLERQCNLGVLLPSFSVFISDREDDRHLLFELVEKESWEETQEAEFLEEDDNDLGKTRIYRTATGYRITLSYSDKVHVMDVDPEFRKVSALLRWDDEYVSVALSSMLRIAFAQSILMHSSVSVHASAVVSGGEAVLFMGRSGTGKSTHSRLWLENVPDTRLLNDDNPIVRIVDGEAMVYGSPWSGKTPCYLDESAPIAAMVRLAQAPENRFSRKSDVEAFSILLPGCSVLRSDRRLFGAMCETLIELTEIVCVGEMRCLPDRDAAFVCRRNIVK